MDTPLPSFARPASDRTWSRLWQWVALLALLGLVAGCASLPPNTERKASTAFVQPDRTPLGQLANARRAQAGARSDSGFRLLDGVDIALTSRVALIENATRSLDLQYYAIHADASTEVLLQRLREAARRGVRVRILLDDFNSVGADAQVLRLAFEPNIELRLFNPLTGPRGSMIGRLLSSLQDIESAQKRMHNKLFLADNAWGITGGRNLGDRYFGTNETQNFVDLDVLAAGRIVRDMSASFDRFWNDELAYPVERLLAKEDLDKMRKPQASENASDPGKPEVTPTASLPPVTTTTSVLPSVSASAVAQAQRGELDLRTVELVWAPATLLVDKPGKVGPDDDEVDAGDTVIDGLLSLMQQARRDVLIISPYFVPGAQMMAVYEQLRRRGVRLRVLTNSLASNDAPAAHAGYARYREAMLDLGAELYEMHSDPGMSNALGTGSGSGSRGSDGGSFGLGSAAGGSKAGTTSRASLHSKAVVIDGRLSVIGSMNLDLRSKIQNSEVALVLRSVALSQQATRQIENTFATGAYRVERRDGKLYWLAPAGASFADAISEPNASARLKLIVKILGPLAPDEML